MPDGTSSTLHEIKISELPVAPAVSDSDQLEANQAGTSRSITVGQVKTAALAASDPLNVLNFGAKGDGVSDDTTAIQAAITAAIANGGGTVRFTKPGTYLVSSVNLASNITIDIGAGVTVQHKPDATLPCFYAVGAKSGVALALAGTVAAGATSFALTDASTISAGSWIILKDTTDYSIDSAAVGYKSGESLIVKSKATNTLSFDRKVSGSFQADRLYTTARGGNVELVSAPLSNICIRGNGKLLGHKNANIGPIEFRYVDGARVEGVHVETFGGVGVLFRTCRNIIARPRYVADGLNNVAGGFAGYGIAVSGACDVGLVADAFITRTRHGFTTMGSADGGCSRITVDNLTVTENDFTGLDTHAGVHDILFSNNGVFGGNAANASGGINLRANEARVTGNMIVDVPGTAIAVTGDAIFKTVIDSNYMTDADTVGINIASTVSSLDITNNTILRCGNHGLAIGGGAYDTGVSRILIKSNTVRDFGRNTATRSGIQIVTTTASVGHIEDNTVEAVNGAEGRGIYILAASLAGRVHNNVARGVYTNGAIPVAGTLMGANNTIENDPATLAVVTGGSLSATGAALTGALTGTTATMSGTITTTGGTITVDRAGGAAQGDIIIQADAGFATALNLRTGTSNRWIIRKSATAEGGANAGSDLEILARTDAGAGLLTPLTITRATGAVALIGAVTSMSATAVGAGAATQAFIKASSTANLGIYYGTGVPSFSAAKGSLYSCTNATTTTTRLYVNTDGAATWTNLTTAA